MLSSSLIILQCLILCTVISNLCVVGREEERPRVECVTTKGAIEIEVYPEWAPLGARRFLELVDDSFYTDIAMYRCVDEFLTQFGISENPSKKHWHSNQIADDPNLHRGIHRYDVSFAGGGPNTRSTQIFIAFEDLGFLGKEPWETPFARVVSGTKVLAALHKGYGDIAPFNRKGPDQQAIFQQGNQYIRKNFPKTDFIQQCRIMNRESDAVQTVLFPDASVPSRETVEGV